MSSYFSVKPVWWIKNGMFLHDKVKALYAEAGEELVTSAEGLMNYLEDCHVVEWGPDMYFRGETIDVACEPQPPTNKHFDLLAETCNPAKPTITGCISVRTMKCKSSVSGIFLKIKDTKSVLPGWKA